MIGLQSSCKQNQSQRCTSSSSSSSSIIVTGQRLVHPLLALPATWLAPPEQHFGSYLVISHLQYRDQPLHQPKSNELRLVV
jgi:hypothetical protein